MTIKKVEIARKTSVLAAYDTLRMAHEPNTAVFSNL